jgi:hypothetical protein
MINTDSSSLPTANPSRLSLRVNEENPRHHLWNNNGTWWIHYTLHFADYTAQRIRRSLRTSELEEAIRRRDEIINNSLSQVSSRSVISSS